MNFIKNAADKASKAINYIVDSSDDEDKQPRKLKQNKSTPVPPDPAAAKNEDGGAGAVRRRDDNRSSSSSSSVNTEDLEEAGAIVADVFTGGIYGDVESGIEAAELAEATYKKDQMKKSMQWMKSRRVFLVRHGNAGDSPKDEERRVTSKGEGQCAAFRSSYASELDGVTFAFCSPANRAVETARLLGFPDAVAVPELYFGPHLNKKIRALESQLGYAPIAEYLRGKGEEIYDPVRTRMGTALGKAGMSEMENKNGEKDGDVLIVGHAMYLSLLALEVLGALKYEEEEETTAMEKAQNTAKVAWENIKTLPQLALEEAKKMLGEQTGEDDAVEATCEEVAKILSFNMGEVEGIEISAQGQVRLLQAT